MEQRSAILSAIFLVITVLAQQSPHNAASATSTSIDQVRESWMRNFNAKNTDGILALYSENATAGTFHGREGIRPWVPASIDQGSRIESIAATEEKSSGTLAYGTGRSRRWVGTNSTSVST